MSLDEQISKNLAILVNRTGLGIKQLYLGKDILTRQGLKYFTLFLQKQISRNIISGILGSELLKLADKFSAEKIKEILNEMILLYDYISIAPFIESFNEFKSLLEDKLSIKIENISVWMEKGWRNIELKLLKGSTNWKSVIEISENFYQDQMKKKLSVPNYYLTPNFVKTKIYLEK